MKKPSINLLIACIFLVWLCRPIHAEEVHMGFWGGQWHVVRQQQIDSAHAEFRAPAQFIASTSNFPWALQMAFNTLPNNPSGSATRSLLRVRHTRTWTNSEHAYHINSEAFGHSVLRNKNNVTIDFEGNQFVTDGGTGAFINAGSLQGLTIKDLTVHSRPTHTGAHVINLMGIHNATIEGFRCYRNAQGGIGIRADGSRKSDNWWMMNLLIHGHLDFRGGASQKFAIETMAVNIMNVGHLYMQDCPGGICINGGINTAIHIVEGFRVSPGAVNNYAALRYANNCAENNRVGQVRASECGRALASVTSPDLNLWAGYVQAVNCTELGIRLNGGSRAVINGAYIEGGVGYGGIEIGSNDSIINNFTVVGTQGLGIRLGGSRNQLMGGHVVACRGSGIVESGSNNKIAHCNVRKNGGAGVGLGGSGTLFEHAAVYENSGLGIEVTGRPVTMNSIWSTNNAWTGSFFNGSRDRTGVAIVSNSSIDWR
jgi:hypothetical protein